MSSKKKVKPVKKTPAKPAPKAAPKKPVKPAPKPAAKPAVKKPAGKPAAVAKQRAKALSPAELLEESLVLVGRTTDPAEIFRETSVLFHRNIGGEVINLFEHTHGSSFALLGAATDEYALFFNTPTEEIRFKEAPEKAGPGAVTGTLFTATGETAGKIDATGRAQLWIPIEAGGEIAGGIVLAMEGAVPAYSERDAETGARIAFALREVILKRHLARIAADAKQKDQNRVEEIRALKQSVAQAESTHNAARQAESTRIREEARILLEKTKTELEGQVGSLKEERRRAVEERDEKIRSLEGRVAHVEKDLRTAHEEELRRIKASQEEVLRTLKSSHDTELKKLETSRESALREQLEKFSAKDQTASKEIETLRRTLQESTAARNSTEQKIQSDRDALEKKITELESRIAANSRKAEDEILQRELQIEEKAKALADLRSRADAASQTASSREAETKRTSEERDRLRKELEEFRKTADAKDADAKKRTDALTTELHQLQAGIAEERKSRAEEGRQRAEEASALKRELDALRSELQAKTGSAESLASRSLELEKTVREKDELVRTQSEKAAKEIESLKSRLESMRAGLEQERTAAEAELRTTIAGLEKRRDELEQSETRYLQDAYEAVEKAKTAESTLERERAEASEERARLTTEIVGYKGSVEKRTRELADLKSESDRILAETERREAELKKEKEALEQSVADQTSALAGLKQEKAAAAQAVQRLESELREREEKTRRERDVLQEEHRAAAGRLEEELSETRETLQTTKERLQAAGDQITILQQEASHLRLQKEELTRELEIAAEKQKELRRTIEERETQIELLTDETERLTGEIRKIREEADELRQVGERARQEIGMQRDRAARLEQAIANLEEEKHDLRTEIVSLKETEQSLNRNVDSLAGQIQALKKEIDERETREKKLGEELHAAQARERGSRDEGRVLADITGALARISDLRGKMSFLLERMSGRITVERISVYNFRNDSSLNVEESLGVNESGSLTDLSPDRSAVIRLRDTVFGEPVAARKPRIFEGLVDPEFASEKSLSNPKAVQTLVVPLAEGDAAFGIMTITSPRKFTETQVRLMENIAPIVAVALKFEQNRVGLAESEERRVYLDEVTGFLLSRVGETVKVMSRDMSDDNRADLPLTLQMLPDVPSTTGIEGLAEAFPAWVTTLLERAASRGMKTHVDLGEEALAELERRTGGGLRHIYWLLAESVENAIQHSQARNLEIKLFEDGGSLHLHITDDGEGLVRTAGSENPRKGRGLPAVRNLAGAAGGRAVMARSKEGGLSVQVTWKTGDR